MIRFTPVPRPRGWQTHVLAKGRTWLGEGDHRDAERPKDLWSKHRDDLAAGFRELCGYTVMWAPNGTVDHYVPWATVRGTPQAHLAYQWSNLRHAVGWFNSARGTAEVVDPYLVDEDWFELLLPSLELIATDKGLADGGERVRTTLRWLGKDSRVLKVRRGYFTKYKQGKCTLELLDDWAPLISRALRKNPAFLLPADRVRLGC